MRVNSFVDRFFICFTTKYGNQFLGCSFGNFFYTCHCIRTGVCNNCFASFRLFSNLCIRCCHCCIQVRFYFRFGRLDDPCCFCTSVDQCLLIGLFSCCCFCLQIFGCCDVICDRSLTFSQNRRNARERNARQNEENNH